MCTSGFHTGVFGWEGKEGGVSAQEIPARPHPLLQTMPIFRCICTSLYCGLVCIEGFFVALFYYNFLGGGGGGGGGERLPLGGKSQVPPPPPSMKPCTTCCYSPSSEVGVVLQACTLGTALSLCTKQSAGGCGILGMLMGVVSISVPFLNMFPPPPFHLGHCCTQHPPVLQHATLLAAIPGKNPAT